MAKYTKLVQNQAELIALKAYNDFITPNVTLIYDNRTIDFTPYTPPHDYSQDYFTIEALESGTLNIEITSYNSDSTKGYLQYSLDDGETWSEEYGSIEDLSLNANDKLLIKGDITIDDGASGGNNISYTGDFNVYGNIMSLVYEDNFTNQTSLAGKNTIFWEFFSNNTTLLSAENLILPATTLAYYCYQNMFSGCTSLITAPELPATTLVESCYVSMFNGCTSLTTAPELPATTLTSYCYYDMFEGCTALTTTPELPATTLATGCYDSMFKGCTNLNSITCLATDISASDCTYSWVDDVAASGTFTKAASMTGWTTGNDGIPSGWTVEDAS